MVGVGALQGVGLAFVVLALFRCEELQRCLPYARASVLAHAGAALLLREMISPRAQLPSTLLFAITLALCLADLTAARARS
jgi:hypothetical protein